MNIAAFKISSFWSLSALLLMTSLLVPRHTEAFETLPIYVDSVQSNFDTACSETSTSQAIITNWASTVHSGSSSIRVDNSKAALCFYFDSNITSDEVSAIRFWVYPEASGINGSIFIHFSTGAAVSYTFEQMFGVSPPAGTWSHLSAAIPVSSDSRLFNYLIFRFDDPGMIVYFDDIDLLGQDIFASDFE